MSYKLVNAIQLDEDLTSIADAIRAKDGSTNSLLFPNDYISKIGQFYKLEDIFDRTKPEGAIIVKAPLTNSDYISSGYAFYNRTGITEITFENAVTIPQFICQGCSNLTKVYAPKCKRMGYSSFEGTKITNIVLPEVTSFEAGAFMSCTNMTGIDIGKPGITPTLWDQNTWRNGGNKIDTIIIRHSVIFPLKNVLSITSSTKFASGQAGGTLYVPSALIDSYKSANYWSEILTYENNGVLQNQILPIEGSQYETHYIDGSVIE